MTSDPKYDEKLCMTEKIPMELEDGLMNTWKIRFSPLGFLTVQVYNNT